LVLEHEIEEREAIHDSKVIKEKKSYWRRPQKKPQWQAAFSIRLSLACAG
jgi:hypothetical protein